MRWRREVSFLLVIFIALAVSIPGVLGAEVDQEIYSHLEQNSQVSVIIEYEEAPEIKISGVDTKSLESSTVFSATVSLSAIQQLNQDPNVKTIYYDYPVKANLDVSVSKINASQVWTIQFNSQNITGKDQTVCVVDTGINYTHPALGGCAAMGGNCKVLAGIDYANNDADPMDDNGHGSHVAGIVASTDATYRGVAPDAKLVAVKSLNAGGTGYSSNVTAGINWCKDNKDAYNITAIVLSLSAYHANGTEKTFSSYCDAEPSSLIPAINNAVGEGIVVTVSSGNSAEGGSIGLPACVTNSTSVGATDDNDNRADFSNVAAILDFFAPGKTIKSVDHDGTFEDKSGTSMAAPHVAGAVALLQQYEKLESAALTPAEIEIALNNTGITVLVGSFKIPRIDIKGALNYIDNTAPADVTNFGNDNITSGSVYLNWTNPTDTDFSYTEIFVDGTAQVNITDGDHDLIGLTHNTTFEIFVYATDDAGNQAAGVGENITTAVDVENPVVSLNSPVNATNISEGTTIDLSITDNGAIDFASYSVNGGTAITLTDPWDIDTNGWTAGVKSIEVLAIDTGNNTDTDTFEFTVTNVLPAIGTINPNGSTLTGTIDFNATVNDTDGQTDIDYVAFFALDGGTWALIGNDTTATGNLYSASFDTTTVTDGATTLRVNASDDDGTVSKDVSVTIDNTNEAPIITLTVPNGGETVTGIYFINWTSSDPENDTLTFDVHYFVQGSGSQTIICDDASTGTCEWDSDSVNDGDYRINVTATDGVNFASDASTSNFTIDNSGGSGDGGSSSGDSETGEVTVPSGGGGGAGATEETTDDSVQTTDTTAPENVEVISDNKEPGFDFTDLTGAFSFDNLQANPETAALVIGALAAAGAVAFFALRGGKLPGIEMPEFELPGSESKSNRRRRKR